MADYKFLEELSNAHAIAGDEQQMRDILNKRTGSKVDEVSSDGLGSIIFKLNAPNSDCPSVMLASHIDEIG